MTAPGEELRAARQRARVSLRTLAERAGISRGYLSKAENGHLVPTWDVLVRIAEVLDCEPHLRLLPSQNSLAARARAMARMTAAQRLAGHEVEPEDSLRLMVDCGLRFVVTGAVAGVLQGLPMTIEEMSVAVADDEESLGCLTEVLMRAGVLFRELDSGELRAMCAERSWAVGWCDVRFDHVEELPEATEMVLGERTVQLLPLTALVAQDRDAADVFDLLRRLGVAG